MDSGEKDKIKMRMFLGIAVLASLLLPGNSHASTILLNALNSYSYEIEPGAFITQPGIGGQPSPDIGTPGAGPILGVGLLFAVGGPDTADLSVTNDIIGFDRDGAFYFGGQAIEIINNDIKFTAIIAGTGNLYLIDFLSWRRDIKPCLDNDGTSCIAAGGATSFNIESQIVPLPAALPLLAAGLSAMGFMGWRRKRKAIA